MELNADFSQRTVVRYELNDWVPSPMPGVDRRMLDRIGGEVARATTIVRFAPGSAFSPHTHDGGEEYLVLDGTFQDEDGDFPTGTYVRNPPTTSHRPAARDGATIFVKLHQFDPADRNGVRVETAGASWSAVAAGREALLLHEDARERVVMERWAARTAVEIDAAGGLEALIVQGAVTESGETLTARDWLRLPVGVRLAAIAGPEGATLWIKTGHLAAEGLGPAAVQPAT